jgi:predicted nucleotide-binding protein
MKKPATKQPRTKVERPRPLVFIGSSVEGLSVARAIQSAIYHDAEPAIWSQGVFGLSGGTLETLVKECGNFDFAVFVLSPDDLLSKKGDTGNAPRDNVLFELGLFMGRLGRDRTFFVHCTEDKLLLPSDLAGVTAASYLPPSNPRYIHAALSSATTPILEAVKTLGLRPKAITNGASLPKELDELRKQVAEMRITLSSLAAYAQNPIEDIFENTKTQKNGHTLDVLVGTWQGVPSDSTAWCKIERGKARFLYCYQGNAKPTGEYYDWERAGNTLSGKFRWFDNEEIRGYAWFEIAEASRIRGGWWMQHDVPDRLISKLPHVPNMVPLEWHKLGSEINPKANRYFKRSL